MISLLREVGDGFSSMSPSERRQQYIIETKFQQQIDNKATDDDVINGNDKIVCRILVVRWRPK